MSFAQWWVLDLISESLRHQLGSSVESLVSRLEARACESTKESAFWNTSACGAFSISILVAALGQAQETP